MVDDHDQQVTEVVRGDDLIYSTYRQLSILNYLDWSPPSYVHVPLMVGPDGRRLAKRHGDTRVNYLRESSISAEAVIGYLAWTLGMSIEPRCCSAAELVGSMEWEQLPRTPTQFHHAEGLETMKQLSNRHS